MTSRRYNLPEHDLMLHLVWGDHTSAEAIQFIEDLDETCAARWLCYFYPSADLAGMDAASMPAVKRAVDEKRKELFGDKPKRYALVCASNAAQHYFDFWDRYDSGSTTQTYRRLDDAYRWLGLSAAARVEAAAIIQGQEAQAAALIEGEASADLGEDVRGAAPGP